MNHHHDYVHQIHIIIMKTLIALAIIIYNNIYIINIDVYNYMLSFQIDASQLDVIYLLCYNVCILCAIYLHIIDIYV